MRRLFTGFMVALLTAAIPALALANSNQQLADQIAHTLRYSGQMSDYQVGVKFQNGTAWLHGRVASDEQMETAIRLAFQIKAVDRVVNELTVSKSRPAAQALGNPLRGSAAAARRTQPRRYQAQPLEAASDGDYDQTPAVSNWQRTGRADRVPSSYVPQSAERTSGEEFQEPAAPQPIRPRTRQTAMQPGDRMHTNGQGGAPLPVYRAAAAQGGPAPARYDQPCMPNYAWPSYAAYPNYAAVTYPKQYSPTAWPYIGPFYPYPQVPLGWRKVTLEWSDGWWFLDFKDQPASCWHR